MKTKEAIIGILVAVLIGIVIGTALNQINQINLPTTTTVKTIGVTATWSTGDPVASLDFGFVDSGVPVALPLGSIIITNTGNIPITLSITWTEPQPTGATVLITSDYSSALIAVNGEIPLLLIQTLTGPAGTYNYEITITGVEAT